MKDLYDRRFVHFDWDDSLEGKECIFGDNLQDIKTHLAKGMEFASVVKQNPNNKELYPFMNDKGWVYRFCYYDPLLVFKVAKKMGKRVESRFTDIGNYHWKEVPDDGVWTQDMEYRIVEEDDSDMITIRQLSMWLAKGNGEFKFKLSEFVDTSYAYNEKDVNKKIKHDTILVRRWGGNKWHEPTMEYCFPKGTDE